MNDGDVHSALLQNCRLFLDVVRIDDVIVVDGCCEDAGAARAALSSDPGVSFELGCVGVDFFQCSDDLVLELVDVLLHALAHWFLGRCSHFYSPSMSFNQANEVLKTDRGLAGGGRGRREGLIRCHHAKTGESEVG